MKHSPTVGLLHPGAMGATVGATCNAPVVWCADGRSDATRARAEHSGLNPLGSLAELVERSDVIVSVCPPDRAVELADDVAAHGFEGLYVDANAIAPNTARSVAERFERFVDGGIIGPPATRPSTTRLYLAGDEAEAVGALWDGSMLHALVVDGPIGAASALKMAYATWTKVSGALLLDVRALARAEGVERALLAEWDLSQQGTAERSKRTAAGVAPKAWRFIGEMREIERAFEDAGLPTGFALGATDLYERVAHFKDVGDVDLEQVLEALLAD